MSPLARYKARKRVQEFMSSHGMTFHGFGGLVANNLVVSEFGYLLRYLTDGKLDSLNNLRAVCENRQLILNAISVEVAMEPPRESEVFHYPREIAVENLKNLEGIVETLCGYVELCDRYGFDLREFAAEEKEGFAQKLSSTMGGAILAASLATLVFSVFDGEMDGNTLSLVAGLVGGLVGIVQNRMSGRRKKGERS